MIRNRWNKLFRYLLSSMLNYRSRKVLVRDCWIKFTRNYWNLQRNVDVWKHESSESLSSFERINLLPLRVLVQNLFFICLIFMIDSPAATFLKIIFVNCEYNCSDFCFLSKFSGFLNVFFYSFFCIYSINVRNVAGILYVLASVK